jgi:outer membrane lipopolysaccharide assembly protein LptE/RlpB
VTSGRIAVAAVLLCAAACAACGYKLAGANRFLPPTIRTIAVPPFENATSRAEIEQRITEQVLEEFIRRGGYHTQADPAGADALLEGVVTSYVTQPVEFTQQGKATRIEVTVQARVVVTDLQAQRVLWSQDHFIFRGQYDVPERSRDFSDREIVAIEQIARDFARTVVTSILEGF